MGPQLVMVPAVPSRMTQSNPKSVVERNQVRLGSSPCLPLTHSKEPRVRESGGGGNIQRTWSHGQVRARWSGGIWNKPSNEACANERTHQSERDTVGERDRSLPSFTEISLTSTPSCFVPYRRPLGFEPIEPSWRYGVEQYAKFLQRPRDCESLVRERERERERERDGC